MVKCVYTFCNKRANKTFYGERYCEEHFLDVIKSFKNFFNPMPGKKIKYREALLLLNRHLKKNKTKIFMPLNFSKEYNIPSSYVWNFVTRLISNGIVKKVDRGIYKVNTRALSFENAKVLHTKRII
ncbi:MAG: hypothetical protein RMJ67_06630 [Elusimicrobiota bacterium]|nr:hypothetical protein [Endomicrobiia bacterium]MDW8166169.1 hypothetical protein [Elusimicrobiota bacterium]